jgi:AraC-like DNA-binding protein
MLLSNINRAMNGLDGTPQGTARSSIGQRARGRRARHSRCAARPAVDPASVQADLKLSPKLFDDPDNLMSCADRSRLLGHCVARTGCMHFGLLVGQRGSLYSLGPAGFLVKDSPGVGTARHSLVRYLHLHAEEYPLQVRSVLRTALMTRHAKADQVAALFSMHSRTLHRRLDAFGTGLQQLLDEGRFEIARQLLEDTSMDVSQVAAALDYADASAFGRALRRWAGTSPAHWRTTRRNKASHKA